MRDQKRIEEMMTMLRGLWEEFPDMRFGQLLINHIFKHPSDKFENSMWHQEDDDTFRMLYHALEDVDEVGAL